MNVAFLNGSNGSKHSVSLSKNRLKNVVPNTAHPPAEHLAGYSLHVPHTITFRESMLTGSFFENIVLSSGNIWVVADILIDLFLPDGWWYPANILVFAPSSDIEKDPLFVGYFFCSVLWSFV